MPHWKAAATQTAAKPGKKKAVPTQSSQVPAAATWPRPEDLPLTCDPYLTWAVASQWRGEARSVQSRDFMTDEQQIRVLLRAESSDVLMDLSRHKDIQIAPVYLDGGAGTGKNEFATARFATATLHPSFLKTLLDTYTGVEFELATAVRDQGGPLKGDAKGYFGQQTDLDIAAVRAHVTAGLKSEAQGNARGNAKAPASAPAPGTIAVFDYGCPFLRDEFMDEAGESTRIAAVWHQESFKVERPWTTPKSKHSQGRVLGRAQIDQLIKLSRDPARSADEATIYSGLNYLIDYAHPRRRVFTSTHGAHVLDVAGGTPNPLHPNALKDEACKAKLVFVQMPEDTAGDSSAASLGACLLDALRYTLAVSSPEEPLVVNVSFGNTAGPHDGSSLIEQAMDELLQLRPRNFAVVLAAGNSRHMGLHCRRTPSAKRTALFRINVMPGDRTDTFVEFWYESRADLQFRARLPSGVWSDWVAADAGADLRNDTDGDIVASLIHRKKVPNGNRSLMLLALRPTETPADDEGPLAPSGQWEVEVGLGSTSNSRPTAVDAWIKRDDSRPFGGRVQSTFVGLDRSDADNTLNGLATGSHTIVASGFRWSNGMVVDYASEGPRTGKDQLPLIYGLCEWDSVDPGIRASAVRSRETRLMNGTSVAAPVVARQAFNLMCEAVAGGSPLDKTALWAALQGQAEQRGSVLRVAAGREP